MSDLTVGRIELPPELQDDPGQDTPASQAEPAPDQSTTQTTDDVTLTTDEPESASEPEPERRYAGRFASVEDLEKAYKELQGEYTRISQANAWARKLGIAPSQGTPATGTPTQGPQGTPTQGPQGTPTQGPQGTPSQGPSAAPRTEKRPDLAEANRNFMRAFTKDPLGTMAQLSQVLSAQQLQPLIQSVAYQQAEATLRELDSKYPGVTRERVAEILQAYPGLENAENGLELAYTLAAQEAAQNTTPPPTPTGSVAPQGRKAQDRAKSPEEAIVDEILKAKPLSF